MICSTHFIGQTAGATVSSASANYKESDEVQAARKILDKAMSEADLFESVRAHLDAFGWRWYHTYDSRRSNGGFPDIVATKPRGEGSRLLFIELKSEKGHLSPDQLVWQDALIHSGATHMVWRPSDLSSGDVERTLRSPW